MGQGPDAMSDQDAFRERVQDTGPDHGDDPEARVEQLASEIDETREDLTQTIQAIGEKLEPGNLAHEATETVRRATMGKVEQMTYGAQETWHDVRTGNTGSIVDTITSNPVPSAMVALGLGMLLMNRGSSARERGQHRPATAAAPFSAPAERGRASWEPAEWERTSRGGSPVDRIGATVSDAAEQAGEAVGRATDDAGRAVSRFAGQAGHAVGGAMEGVSSTATALPHQAGFALEQGTGQVRRFVDENPLGAGVVAMAAGAVLGLVLPATRMERETVGPARDRVVEQAEGTVHQALDRVEEQARETASGGSGSSSA